MKFFEYILNSSKVTEGHDFVKKLLLKSSKGCNSKSINTLVMVIELCMLPNVG